MTTRIPFAKADAEAAALKSILTDYNTRYETQPHLCFPNSKTPGSGRKRAWGACVNLFPD